MSDQSEFRTEKDSLGEVRVPAQALWQAQTQRAVDNFPVSGRPMPAPFFHALGYIKRACAQANVDAGFMDASQGRVICRAAEEVAAGQWDAQFPVDVFQTGSGTSSNMNCNEVVASLANRYLQEAGEEVTVHPNDHVNMGQSSNDVVPTAMHLSAAMQLDGDLLPALQQLIGEIRAKASSLSGVVKTGRTHLMDAMPLSMEQELGGWASQLEQTQAALRHSGERIAHLALGGTAVGTGINSKPQVVKAAVGLLAQWTSLPLKPADDYFAAMSTLDGAVDLSSRLRALALNLTKIANDLRWMNSGPLAGIGEIELQALQPGSSIMPGKVNPVIPEAVAMVAAEVVGNDATIGMAASSGAFQLNVMLPLASYNLLESLRILSSACRLLATSAIKTFTVREDSIQGPLARNPILVTALNPVIGYAAAAEIAKAAYKEGRSVVEVAVEKTGMSEEELTGLLNPAKLIRPEG